MFVSHYAASFFWIAACTQQSEAPSAVPSEEAAIQINPLPEAVSKDKETARLYFGYMQEALLIGEVRVFSVPINENSEASIIAELIKGLRLRVPI